MPFGWVSAAGAVLGAVSSMDAADAQAEAAENAKNPWKGAEPWITDNIAQGRKLQDHYTQNPFNALQQEGMNGLVDGYRHQNNVVIPGLMGFSNGLMGTNYQRAPSRGAGGGELQGLLASNGLRGQGNYSKPGLLSAPTQPQQMQQMPAQMPPQQIQQGQPMQSMQPTQPMQQPQQQMQPQQGPFSMPQSQQAGTPLNFNSMNPLYVDPATVTKPEPYVPTEGEVFRNNFADAMFPEGEQLYGAEGPTTEEQYWRNKLGRPAKYMDRQGG